MSTAPLQIPPPPSPEPVFPLSVEQYHQMIDAGVLTEDDPVELLEGILIFKMPKKPKHRFVIRKLNQAIEPMLSSGWFVQLQEPITLRDGEPEPDLAIVRGVDEDFISRHPAPSETALVIEVSDSTLSRDRGIKLRSYARAGISMYWVVDLAGRKVEAYANPDAAAPIPDYHKKVIYDDRSKIPLELAGQRVGEIAVASIFP